MRIDLDGRSVRMAGRRHAVAEAAATALAENGALLVWTERPVAADLCVIAHPLDLDAAYRPDDMITFAEAVAALMARSGGGRIIHLIPAAALVPMRRHAAASATMAAVVAATRGLAMQAAPDILVNAVAIGALDAATDAGDPAMLTHVPLARPGRIEEAIAALLFLADPMNTYTTGQVLAVDGGWTAGYGRDF